MKNPLHLGQILAVHARLSPNRTGARDLERTMTFSQWNRRSCRLANGLLGLGLAKGDRVAILAYNCVEWAEIYAATAKAGLVAVPINFRLVGPEVRYIIENAEAAAVIVQDELAGVIEEIRKDLPVPAGNFMHFGMSRCPAGYRDYETVIAAARDSEPDQQVLPSDPSALMYTSGTTGHPKGAIRTHHGATMLSLVGDIEFGFTRDDGGLLVMPMCHANSLYCFGAFVHVGAVTTIYSRKSFDPEHCVRTLGETGSTFTSLVPTHYVTMLGLPAAVRAQQDLGKVTKLLISSAPARPDTKRAVMEMFPRSGLHEFYGATETGWVTMLHPYEQFANLGSVGRECVGSAPIKLLDEAGREVPDGETGELYSSTPYTFDGYWKSPQKTQEAFRGDYCTVGDMARRDADGFIRLVDRKSNMIISGGENVYPSEIEALVGAHPMVKEVAVIGLPDEKWGERVHAVVVPQDGVSLTEADLADWSKERAAGYKRPRSYTFVSESELPRNGLGKLLYRELKAKFMQPAASMDSRKGGIA
jgi:acyl-CoA synthetase (AMP-forming)/AMP-acid ligase II